MRISLARTEPTSGTTWPASSSEQRESRRSEHGRRITAQTANGSPKPSTPHSSTPARRNCYAPRSRSGWTGGAGGGYSSGYSRSGPAALSEMIEQIVKSDGHDVSATEPPLSKALNERVFSWVSSEAACHTQELSPAQLKTLCRTGMVR